MRHFLYSKGTRVNSYKRHRTKWISKSVDFATQVFKKGEAWKFLVQLIPLTVAFKELFRFEQMILYCFEIRRSIYYIAYGFEIFAYETYRGRKILDLSFGLADQPRYPSSRQLS